MTDYVKEGTTYYVEATFKDKGGSPVAPASARYRIDCLTNGQQVLDWTDIGAPQAVHELTIKPSQNLIINAASRGERRLVTVECFYGADDGVKNQVEYTVLNMKGVS